MTTATAHERHRAHHIRVPAIVALLAACSTSTPRPPFAPVAAEDYIAVPFQPPTPPPEYLPPRPHKDAVWINGTWEWRTRRYLWRYGSWVVLPRGASYAPWTVVRRKDDGQIFFAPSSFRDADGKKLDDRLRGALGRTARARARPGQSQRDMQGDDTDEVKDFAPESPNDSNVVEEDP
jgi:hypothetical protein